MGPVEAIRSCLRQYAGLSGRAARSEFWWWSMCAGLIFSIVSMVLLGIQEVLLGMEEGGGSVALAILWLGVLIPSLAVTVRRLHDTDWSGWWALSTALCNAAVVYAAAFGPHALGFAFGSDAVLFSYLAASGIALVVLVRMFLPGTRGDNRFGPDPLYIETER